MKILQYFKINGLILCLALLKRGMVSHVTHNHTGGLAGLWTNGLMDAFIACICMCAMSSVKKEKIQKQKKQVDHFLSPLSFPITKSNRKIIIYFISSSILKSLTHHFIWDHAIVPSIASVGVGDWIFALPKFIMVSFLYEIVFDLVHYGMHRLCHVSPVLYPNIHKIHHHFKNPSAWTTYYMHPVDLIFSYSLPYSVTSVLFSRIFNLPEFFFTLEQIYLVYTEVGGHVGLKMYPTSSFPQCTALPRLFGIELYTEDHDLHHSQFNCNYSKRYTLWDKVFGTYRSNSSTKTTSVLEK